MQIKKCAEGNFTIDNFLTTEECHQLVIHSESMSYQPADVDVHGQLKMLTSIRTNERVDIESPALVKQFLW